MKADRCVEVLLRKAGSHPLWLIDLTRLVRGYLVRQLAQARRLELRVPREDMFLLLEGLQSPRSTRIRSKYTK